MSNFTKGIITSVAFLQKDIVSLWFREETISKEAVPGQFINLYSGDKSRMLPRPISICRVNPGEGTVRLVFRIAGEGTREFSGLHPGDELEMLGPLGNGYDLSSEAAGNDAIIIGGGIGIPPMLELADTLKHCKPGIKIEIVLGYRNSDTFLLEDFKGLGSIHIATEDGSLGTRGNVIDAIKEDKVEGKVIYSCGPIPMLKGIKQYSQEQGIKAFVSLEERMACGVGACLACVCKSKNTDSHSNVNNKRICKDGPVFDVSEIEI